MKETTAIRLVNVSNPAAYGIEWVNGDNGNRYQLVNERGTSRLTFGVLIKGSDTWLTQRVIAPERFGVAGIITSYRAFEAIVRAYVEA